MTKSPVSLARLRSVVPCVSLINVIVAPGMTPPCASLTVPATVAVACAAAGAAARTQVRARSTVIEMILTNLDVMTSPDDYGATPSQQAMARRAECLEFKSKLSLVGGEKTNRRLPPSQGRKAIQISKK
jgi:hypothetical protein